MIGSARVFRETADRFFDVAEHGPGAQRPHERHYCAEIHPMDGVLAPGARGIPVEYTGRWL